MAEISYAQPAKKEYRIALILPFKTSGYHGRVGEAMLDYYEGFRMAAEALEAEGLKLSLYVFDSEKDSASMETIMAHPDMPKMDIIVGPVYEKNMAIAEDFCKKKGIVLVSPLKFCKPDNPRSPIINFFVPDSIQVSSIASKSLYLFPGYKFYIATDNTPKSKEYVAFLKRGMGKTPVKTITWNNGALAPIVLPKDSIVILSAIPRASSKDALNTAVKNKQHAFLFAHLEWHNPSQSTFEMNEPKIIYPELNFVNPEDSMAGKFRNAFFDKYYSEPSKFAFLGYDQATWLCYGLMTYGRGFINHLPDAEYRGFISVIHLQPTKANGVLNIGINYLQILEEERREYEP